MHQPTKASTEMRAPLYPFPRSSPVARTEPTEPRFVVARPDVCEIQTTLSSALASINARDDVTRTEIWIIGPRPSLPRLTPEARTACAWTCHPSSLHYISSPLLLLPAASITTSSGPRPSCLSSSACSSPPHLAQGAPRKRPQLSI